MTRGARSILLLMLAVMALMVPVMLPASGRDVFPEAAWTRIEDPREVGSNAARLEELRAVVGRGQTTGMMVVVGGRVLFELGDTAEVSYVASVRKSIESMLYGKYVTNGTIPLGKSLRALRIDDTGGLRSSELDATVGDLLAARSGVYHPAANLGDASERAPARGSVRHGTYFLYNNWDFNALGAILERETGRSIYELFAHDIATPIGMQDWTIAAHADAVRNDTKLSAFPAQHFLLSTRDMARLGYLMLRQGRWNGREVISKSWVERSTRLVTPASEVMRTSPFITGLGYGYLWWVFDRASFKGTAFDGTALDGAYTASGAYGQYITVIPRLDMVVAHKTAVPPPRNVTNDTYFGTILPRVAALLESSHSR
jgi:CubicO group peptidase (beta-lactamase class C family)